MAGLAGGPGAAGAEGGQGPGCCDAVLLAPLTEDTFLHNLHVRFKEDVIYTWVGDALVSVNPGRPLAAPLYSPDLARAYIARPPHTLPPHVYGVAATALRRARDRGEAQCIVMTGESGAGKTEAARVCLQCTVLAGGGGGGGAVGAALTAAGTLLEAFGHAATALNHNASRFGKLLDVELDFKGEPVGGHITHFLLEKSRASGLGVGCGERNFHVLYQLLAGADVALLKRLRLQRAWQHYRVLRGGEGGAGGGSPRCSPGAAGAVGRCSPLPAAPDPRAASADKDHFAFTKAALATLGWCSEERLALVRVLAFLLKLGNVGFEPAPRLDGSLAARLLHAHELEEACALVGVCADQLAVALGAAGPSRPASPAHCAAAAAAAALGDCTDSEMDGEAEGELEADWCSARRDRLLAALYGRLFGWLVAGVNARLASGGGGGGGRTVAIVDVYGLEALAHNALERLLINVAAERVQAAVSRLALRRPQDELLHEGLPWTPVRPPDHDLAADLLDAGAESVLGMIRECSSRPLSDRDRDRALLQRLSRTHHPRLIVSPPHHFQITHFGGAVVYDARGMCAADRDGVCRRAAAALARGDPLLRALFAPTAPAASPRRSGVGGGASLAGRQRAQLAALVRRLAAAAPAPRLVRCLRADPLQRPRRFDARLVRHQLHSQGIVEMALVRRAGWCESMSAEEVLARYGLLAGAAGVAPCPSPAPSPPPPLVASPVRAARRLLRALPIPSGEFAFGRSRVFVRSPRTVWELEELRARRVHALVAAAQRAWRRHRRRRRDRAQRLIADAWRRHRARRATATDTVPGGSARSSAAAAVAVIWRAWAVSARRRYLSRLWRRLPARHLSPVCGAWPPCPYPRLLSAVDAQLRQLHHRWRCARYRRAFDQTARNRMREKVTASLLFLGRKALYIRSVAHPFVGDYVRLRASGAWRRSLGAPAAPDRYVVFADVVRKVRPAGNTRRLLAVLSTRALLLLEARTLRVRRRLPAHHLYRLALSPFADDLLLVRVRAAPGDDDAADECGATEAGSLAGGGAGAGGAGCLAGEARRGDVLLRATHVLELATKLFLVVQNAVGAPPHVEIATMFEAELGGAVVQVRFHAGGGGGGCSGEGEPRLLRRTDRLDVLL